MRTHVAAMATAALVLVGTWSAVSAADESTPSSTDGWQQLMGNDSAAVPVAAASSASTVLVAPAKSVEPATKAVPVWTIRAGYPVGQELKRWGTPLGWNVVWQMPRDVIAASTTSFSGDFPTAVSDVVKTLADNGALIRAQIYDGNRTVVIVGPGVIPQQ